MNTYDVYAIPAMSLDDGKNFIERALSISLSPHESSFHGGNYYRHGRTGEENFVLQKNERDDEGELSEQCAEGCLLFYVNRTARAEEIEALLLKVGQEVRLLKRRTTGAARTA